MAPSYRRKLLEGVIFLRDVIIAKLLQRMTDELLSLFCAKISLKKWKNTIDDKNGKKEVLLMLLSSIIRCQILIRLSPNRMIDKKQ